MCKGEIHEWHQMQFRHDDCDLLAKNSISIALTKAVHLIWPMPSDLPNGPEWPRGQWQDRNARLRKHGNRVIFPEAGLPPAPVLSGNAMTTEARTNLGLPPAAPPDDPMTPHNLAARSSHFRQWHDHEARTNFGPPATSPTDAPRTARRLVAYSGHGGKLSPRRPDTPRAAAIFTGRRISGVLPPTCPPPTGRKSLLPLLPLLPLPANSGSLPR